MEDKKLLIYEDKEILVCYKRAGLATQSANPMYPDLESRLRNYLHGGELHIVHRLDQPVEGLLVFAKNRKAAAELGTQVNNGQMKKVYRALICGRIKEKNGVLTDYLVKLKNGLGQVVSEEQRWQPQYKDAKRAELSYREVRYFEMTDVSELEIHLKTGRFHQIRLQMSHAGHPLVGDTKYGGSCAAEKASRLGLHSVALSACHLELIHPGTGKKMQFDIVPEFEQKM